MKTVLALYAVTRVARAANHHDAAAWVAVGSTVYRSEARVTSTKVSL